MKQSNSEVRKVLAFIAAMAGVSLSACGGFGGAAGDQRPNVLVIVADDLGYSDLGAFGSEISTPNLDALAAQGRILTNFHAGAACSPTRAMLMSGADHHLVGLGQMGEVSGMLTALGSNPNFPPQISQAYAPFGSRNGDFATFQSVPDGYAGYLNSNALSMPELLKDAGYNTYMAGKWHLAFQVKAGTNGSFWEIRPDALPKAKGFERSFALVDGGGAHFAPTPGKLTPQDYSTYSADDVTMPASALPSDFFSTNYYTDRLIQFTDTRKTAERKPFFAYAAYTAPHWPLQAPQADIDAQSGKYAEGYEVIRERRIANLKRLGLVPQGFVANPGLKSVSEGGTGKKRWNELSDVEKASQARLMEVYAAMVANMDANIGRLVRHLKDIGEYDNTLIVFMSDNGAEGGHFLSGTMSVNNDLSNIGKPLSMAEYGERWAEVSSTPFRLWKENAGAEGGTSVPAIVKMPNQAMQRTTMSALAHVTDILPTVLSVAGVTQPAGTYNGRTVYPATGVSLAQALTSADALSLLRPADTVIADELFFNSYVKKGKWKLSRNADVLDATNPALIGTPYLPWADVPWRLYDMSTDRGETQDVSASNPAVVADLLSEWNRYVANNKVLMLNNTFTLPRDPTAP